MIDVVWVLEVLEGEDEDCEGGWTIKGIFATPELAESFIAESSLEEKYGEWIITSYVLNKGLP